MRSVAGLSSLIFILLLHLSLPSAHAKCCRSDFGGDCGDNSAGTPCCGYKKCDGLCCNCVGVQVIREEVDTSWSGKHYVWTTVITAPWSPESGWTTWTCRASHITSWDLPPKTDARRGLPLAAQPTATGTPSPAHHESHPGHGHRSSQTESLPTISYSGPSTFTTVPAFLDHKKRSEDLADLAAAHSIFKLAANGVTIDGADAITLTGYLDFFNVANLTRDSEYARSVVEKFHFHDRNGDGMLTFEESQMLCDAEGCVEA